MANCRFLPACCWVGILAIVGCSNAPPRETPPPLDAATAAQAAIDQYDKDGDKVLTGKELDACPAIKGALAHFDNHGDGRVTAETIAARIKQWQARPVGSMSLGLFVQLDSQPLDGAAVVFEPEKFLGPDFTDGQGTTDAKGFVMIRRGEKSGLPLGLYKIRISKLVGGKETIPAKFNAQTTLGMEVAPATPPAGVTTLNLTTK